MKKRLICLFLCLAMILLPALVACSKNTEDELKEGSEGITDEASKVAKSLSMWIVSENKLSDATKATVSDALNAITKSKFKTELVVTFLTKNEYKAALDKQIADLEAYRATTGVGQTEATTTVQGQETVEVTDATETLANGMSVIKYPGLTPFQTDIIYIAGEDMFNEYVERGLLHALDEQLDGSAKKIREYISSTLLSATELNGVTYAVPNNNVIGEYTYMLLDKALMDKYSQQGYVLQNKIDGFFNQYLYNFLLQVSMFEKDYAPVDASYEDCLGLLAHYWNVDPTNYSLLEDFSVFGYHYTDIEDLSRGSVILGYNSLFENEEFTTDFLKLNELKFNGYFNKDAAPDSQKDKAAVKFVKGDSTVLDTYKDDYYAVVVEYPTASTEDIYSNMFGVCKYSVDLNRSMDIITYLNTNADFRNILQYGVENIHYRLETNEEGTKTNLVRLNNDYLMDIYATGNAFLAHPEPDMSEDIWENGKIQNRSSLVSPLLGFNIPAFSKEAGAVDEKVQLPDEKYVVSYSSGYSKHVLSQNPVIKNWLDASTGDGVHVLKTSLQEGQNLTLTYYILNNSKDGKIFTLNSASRTKTEMKEDKEVTKYVGFDIYFGYTDGTRNVADYELSCVTIHTNRTMDFDFTLVEALPDVSQPIEGQAISKKDYALTEKSNSLITFDFYNTKDYQVTVYENLSKPAIARNKELLAWMLECDQAADKSKSTKTYVKQYTDPATGEITFVVYRTGLYYITDVDVQITGDDKGVNVNINYLFTEEKGDALKKDEVDYLLYYVRVKPLTNNYKANCVIKENGEKTSAVTRETVDVDPDFVMYGKLDTELIKYLYQLNNEIVAVLNSAPDYETLKAAVEELKLVLTTDEKVSGKASIEDFKIFGDVLKNGVVAGDLNEMYYSIQSATSASVVTRNPDIYDEQWTDPVNSVKEDYVYYDSLYSIYQQWMKKYGYLPEED